ncbi:MAG: hydroxyisourate hydrolase [Candidatus Altimarinota bacterium]
MGKLSTHILDTTIGKPASALEIKLYKKVENNYELIKTVFSNNDGRCDEALLEKENLQKGGYELIFDVETYFNKQGIKTEFLKDVVIRFYIEDVAQNYHVPLLITPYSYSTYKGSGNE